MLAVGNQKKGLIFIILNPKFSAYGIKHGRMNIPKPTVCDFAPRLSFHHHVHDMTPGANSKESLGMFTAVATCYSVI